MKKKSKRSEETQKGRKRVTNNHKKPENQKTAKKEKQPTEEWAIIQRPLEVTYRAVLIAQGRIKQPSYNYFPRALTPEQIKRRKNIRSQMAELSARHKALKSIKVTSEVTIIPDKTVPNTPSLPQNALPFTDITETIPPWIEEWEPLKFETPFQDVLIEDVMLGLPPDFQEFSNLFQNDDVIELHPSDNDIAVVVEENTKLTLPDNIIDNTTPISPNTPNLPNIITNHPTKPIVAAPTKPKRSQTPKAIARRNRDRARIHMLRERQRNKINAIPIVIKQVADTKPIPALMKMYIRPRPEWFGQQYRPEWFGQPYRPQWFNQQHHPNNPWRFT
jgi:hypothetical protein